MAKLLKIIGKIARALFNFIVFLAKGLAKIISFVWDLITRAAKKAGEASKQPKSQATYDALKEEKTVTGLVSDFEKKILEAKSTIGIVLGARGSGKSAFGMRILENVHAKTNRKVCAMGFKPETIPGWISCINDLKEIPNGAFVLVDEGGVLFSSRNTMSGANKLLSELLLIARHKDLSVLFISQNSANLEVNALRQADYLVLKKPSLLQKDFERSIVQKVYLEAADGFKEFSDLNGVAYIYSDEFRGFASNSLPSFWSEQASKAFSKRV